MVKHAEDLTFVLDMIYLLGFEDLNFFEYFGSVVFAGLAMFD